MPHCKKKKKKKVRDRCELISTNCAFTGEFYIKSRFSWELVFSELEYHNKAQWLREDIRFYMIFKFTGFLAIEIDGNWQLSLTLLLHIGTITAKIENNSNNKIFHRYTAVVYTRVITNGAI